MPLARARGAQARIGIEQLQQARHLDRALGEVRARAKAELAREGAWLKMWAARRVDVEGTAARALPLILDDVDRATGRLAQVLDGVRIPDEAFRVPGVPPMPAITNVDGGDFSVTVCYRRKTAVFNYLARDDSSHDDLTRHLVKQTLDLLQINPHADAKAREWELRSTQLPMAGATARACTADGTGPR